ncbi:hypothetical protein VHEMI05685 [[Torrubiella] hemipterigena]|uniref:Choline/ethanolamine kinase n=1 Tax=[Torrubiella] hemipterigena TaxID=1531966 RepID=A0A0A1T4W1_9HYPO|nr:hypothetical protein VHEMI05685 [[Torrubiella] hemipterigena]
MKVIENIEFDVGSEESLSPSTIRDLVGAIFPYEWASADPASLTITRTAGYANTNYIVKRPVDEGKRCVEPVSVFVKLHGSGLGNLAVFEKHVPSKLDEARLCESAAELHRLCARPYGLLTSKTNSRTVRVDEVLDARCLLPVDVEHAHIRADIAASFAALHTIEVAGWKNSDETFCGIMARYGFNNDSSWRRLEAASIEAGVHMTNLIKCDFPTKIRQLEAKLDSMGAKRTHCIHDVQFMNVLVKNHPQPGDNHIYLIDYEFAARNYRGFDIGGHFMQKNFQWYAETQIADCRSYTRDEKQHFCAEYAKRWNEIMGDNDTAEQVLAEAELGYLLAISFDLHNMALCIDIEGSKEVSNLLAFNKLYEMFMEEWNKQELED